MAEKEKEIAEVVIKVTQSNGKDRYEVIARRSNYVEVVASDVSTIENELRKVVGLCKVLKTPSEEIEEQTQRLLDFVIKKSTAKEKAHNPDFFRKWGVGETYAKGEYVNHLGLVFYALEDNRATYENIPINTPELWRRVEEEKPTISNANPEYEENIKKAEIYYRDKSYKSGTYVTFYNELYKALKDVKDGEQPHEKSSFWEHIPKKIQNLGI